MMNFTKLALRAALAVGLTASAGCSYLFGDEGMFPDTSQDYKQAREMEPIRVPEGAPGTNLQEIYPIPPIQDDLLLEGEFEVPRPTPLVAGAGEDVVRIQSLGDESWALVAMAPGQLWPQVRSFLTSAGIQVGRVDAQAGIIETSWLDLEGQTMSSRFRFRIEQGVQRGSSELHVLQMRQAGDVSTWPAESTDVGQEQEMLKAVAQFVANSADSAPVSMLADRAMSAEGKLAMEDVPGGGSVLRLGLPFTRGWASVGKALEESRFEVTDRDRSEGIYYVRFLGEAANEEGGWFSWMFSSEDENPLVGRNLLVSVAAAGDREVTVGVAPVAGDSPLERRDQQALLTVLKGNIN
ncbi:MAG: outer membrane protein assembly factor BamC [Haliea sp.]|nr:outer membrane protein assembly factor BamC [Haliea sp.]